MHYLRNLYKIARVILTLYIGLKAKMFLNLNFFLSNSEKVLSDITSWNSLFTIIYGDYVKWSSVWGTGDKTTIKGTQFESLTTVNGFYQPITQPTHLLPQTSSSIDLIFTVAYNVGVLKHFEPKNSGKENL